MLNRWMLDDLILPADSAPGPVWFAHLILIKQTSDMGIMTPCFMVWNQGLLRKGN